MRHVIGHMVAYTSKERSGRVPTEHQTWVPPYTESRTVSKRAVRILLECFLFQIVNRLKLNRALFGYVMVFYFTFMLLNKIFSIQFIFFW